MGFEKVPIYKILFTLILIIENLTNNCEIGQFIHIFRTVDEIAVGPPSNFYHEFTLPFVNPRYSASSIIM